MAQAKQHVCCSTNAGFLERSYLLQVRLKPRVFVWCYSHTTWTESRARDEYKEWVTNSQFKVSGRQEVRSTIEVFHRCRIRLTVNNMPCGKLREGNSHRCPVVSCPTLRCQSQRDLRTFECAWKPRVLLRLTFFEKLNPSHSAKSSTAPQLRVNFNRSFEGLEISAIGRGAETVGVRTANQLKIYEPRHGLWAAIITICEPHTKNLSPTFRKHFSGNRDSTASSKGPSKAIKNVSGNPS